MNLEKGLHDPLLAYCKLSGLTKTATIERALQMYLDYYGVGVLTVFVFYFLHGRKWWCFLGQLAALYWLNVELLGGLMYPVQLFGMEFETV